MLRRCPQADPHLSHPRVVVLLALAHVYQRDRRATFRQVADVAGVNLSTVHTHLTALRRLGMVEWTDGEAGTLRPTHRVVAAG